MNRVVNVRKDFFDVYMGRSMPYYKASPWQNPFHIHADTQEERLRVAAEYAEYFYASEQKWLRDRALAEISPDAILGCWCAPKLCHAEIVAGYLAWKRNELSF